MRSTERSVVCARRSADGRVRASARPGLGVELDDAKLKQYAF